MELGDSTARLGLPTEGGLLRTEGSGEDGLFTRPLEGAASGGD
jgi:hypothetical protein